MLSTTLGRTVAYPLLVLSWACAVSCLGISASLCAHFGNNFPTYHLKSRTILLTFASTWDTIFCLVLMIGVAVAPDTVGLGWSFLLLFLGFLQFVVGASSISKSMPSCEDLDGKCSMFKALEGMAWVETWIVFFTILIVVHLYMKDQAAREAAEAHRKKLEA